MLVSPWVQLPCTLWGRQSQSLTRGVQRQLSSPLALRCLTLPYMAPSPARRKRYLSVLVGHNKG